MPPNRKSKINNQKSKTAAFTLIELLVVITLFMVLAGLAVAFIPRVGEQDRAARGGTMLQGWLNTARSKALLYQSPVGIRLIPNPSNSLQVLQCMYVEQLDDYVGGDLMTDSTDATRKTVLFGGEDVTQGSVVQQGDYLEVLGSGLLHRITSVTNATGTNKLTLASSLPFSITTATKSYRILRGARPLGDEILALPDQVQITLKPNSDYSSILTASGLPPVNSDGSYDILFSPSGAVITPGTTTDIIYLWVNDVNATNYTDGEPSIIAVYTRTGQTAAHPPADGADPFAYVKDGRSSGK